MSMNSDPKTPLLLPAIICHADILGFSSMTECAFESGMGEEFLRKIKRSLDPAYDRVREAQTLSGKVPSIFGMKVFTDNILVAYPLPDPEIDDGEFELGTLLMLFAEVQTRLAVGGFFLRGAITKGPHYQDEYIVYGNAFLDAVKRDRKGEPPRLVIGPSVKRMILKHLSSYGYRWSPYHDGLLEDRRDGRLFVNYLEVAFEAFRGEPFSYSIDYEILETHQEKVRSCLRKYESNDKVLQKYIWIASYHDYVCRMFAEEYSSYGNGDPDSEGIKLEAQRVLDYLVLEDEPVEQLFRTLDAQRLKRRLSTVHTPPSV